MMMSFFVMMIFSFLNSFHIIFYSFLGISFFLLFNYYGGYSDMMVYVDYFSFLLLFLSLFLFYMCLFSEKFSYFSFSMLSMMIMLLVLSFSTNNYFLFFFCFEFVFIIMFLFLFYMGSSMERLQASFYMFFYTMVFSLPFLVGLGIFQYNGFSSFFSLYFSSFNSFIVFFLFFVFLVKLPLYGLHLWLPKAHVQASLSGSMLLAGILLKLGGYGIFRFFMLLDLFSYGNFLLDFIFYLSLFGGFTISLVCLRQSDLKMLIAYSSVVHMSVALMGLLSFSQSGLLGSLLMLVSHGFISPLMFFLMTYLYNVNHSRSLFLIKGLIVLGPIYCFFWFVSCSLNLSLPPFMSFLSELYIFSSMGAFDFFSWGVMFLLLFFSGVYCIFCYSLPSHGSYSLLVFYDFQLNKMLFSFLMSFYVFIFPFIFF
uniref:NADH-ubiquinone oxidoreductase chain 4 n=1 Tax=Histiostomatidae sp. XFX TaxID=2652661 RepID=A0A5J6VDM0_9ACAR|nr:NADH dehydrogenase subunit 4 [Histiostomatidae sp. XFX]